MKLDGYVRLALMLPTASLRSFIGAFNKTLGHAKQHWDQVKNGQNMDILFFVFKHTIIEVQQVLDLRTFGRKGN